MSEFLVRGWNVAIPEVDIGDDIFVVQDENSTLRRVQVKSARSKERKNSFSAQFSIPLIQLSTVSQILLHYVFIVRHDGRWTEPIIIRQDYLLDHFQKENIGSEHNGTLILYFSYVQNRVECSGFDFTKYLSDYTDFPLLEE